MKKLILMLSCYCLLNTNGNSQNLKDKLWLGAGFNLTGSNDPNKINRGNDGINKYSNYNFNITFGKFIKENILLGISPLYSSNYYENSYNYHDILSQNSQQQNQTSETKNFGSALFIRKHFKFYKERLYWWLQPSLNYNYSINKNSYQYTTIDLNRVDTFNRYQESNQKQSQVNNTIGANLSIGATCFIMKNFALTAGISLFTLNYNFGNGINTDYYYRSYKVITPDITETSFKTNGFSSSFAASASSITSISLSFLF